MFREADKCHATPGSASDKCNKPVIMPALGEQVAAPAFMLVDFLLSRQRIARYLFDSFRQPANLKKVLQARPSTSFSGVDSIYASTSVYCFPLCCL